MRQLWSNARLISRIKENAFEHKRNFYAIDAPQAMRIMQQIRTDYELILEDVRTNNEWSSRPCLLCEYDNGVLVDHCEMHRQIDELRAQLDLQQAPTPVFVEHRTLPPTIPDEVKAALRRAGYANARDAEVVRNFVRNHS